MFHQIWTYIFWFFEYLFILFKTLPRDLTGLCKLIRHHIILKYNTLLKRDFINIFRQNVKRTPTKPCFILDDKPLSFQQVCINISQINIIKLNFFLG